MVRVIWDKVGKMSRFKVSKYRNAISQPFKKEVYSFMQL